MRAESLDFPNAYSCLKCNELRPATRTTELHALPPVLNFSIMRFEFDAESQTRKKSQAVLKFPPKINMRPFMHDKLGDDVWYVLKGVIEHSGTSVSTLCSRIS